MSRSSEVESDVLVVGAGPVGLTAACELWEIRNSELPSSASPTRRGLRIRVIDRKAEPSAYSKAFGGSCAHFELFEKIGIAEELVAAGTRVGAVNIWFALADVEVDGALLERELPRRAWREAHGCFPTKCSC